MHRVEGSGKRRGMNLADYITKVLNTSRVIIATKNGVIYEGTLVTKDHGFLLLRDVTIRGKKYTAKVSHCLLKPDIIQHIHPPPIELLATEQEQE